MSRRRVDRVLQELTHRPIRPLGRLVLVQPLPGHQVLVQLPPALLVLSQLPPALLVLGQPPPTLLPGQQSLDPSLHNPLRSPLVPVLAPAPDPGNERQTMLLPLSLVGNLRFEIWYWHLRDSHIGNLDVLNLYL